MAYEKAIEIKKRRKIFFFLIVVFIFGGIEVKEKITLAVEKPIEQTVVTGTEKEIEVSIIAVYNDSSEIAMNKIIFFADDITEQVYTLKVQGDGGLYLALASADNVPFQSLKLQVYSDASFTKKIGKDYIVKSDTKVISTKSYYLEKSGTYYLKFTYAKELGQEQQEKAFGMTAAFMYSTDRELKEGENLVTYANAKQKAVYYKINLKKDGLISYTAVPEDGKSLLTGHIQLCDKNKEPISVSEYVSSSKNNNNAINTYYAIKKGIYYIKAKLNTSYLTGFTLEKVKDTAGTDMTKASKLKVGGREKKSVLYLSDDNNIEKWYQFHLEKNQNFSIIINSCVNGYLNIEVCNYAGNTVKSGSINFYTGTKILKTSSKWQKGNYYIKVSKVKKSIKSSGYFSMKIKI